MNPIATLKRPRLLEPSHPNRGTKIVGGECSGLLNWNDEDEIWYDISQTLEANFWRPVEIKMKEDEKMWDSLTPIEQDTFLRVGTALACLDSLQVKAILEVIRFTTNSALANISAFIAQQEATHTTSYSYITSSLVRLPVQNQYFNETMKHPVLAKRNKLVLDVYEDFAENPSLQNLFRMLVQSINLEGIYFYSGFAFFYWLASQQKMMKSSTMISYIQRDEMQHAYFIGLLIRRLLTENPELNTQENAQYIVDSLKEAVTTEKEWAGEILADIEGLDLEEFDHYIEYLANKRVRQLGMDNIYEERGNPMPWIQVFSDEMMEHTKTDQFENKSRDYSGATKKNNFASL